ncbi:MAG TPA: serine/threonine-protein kinase [Acidobacteriota bacterium]|nr:serine/threonine-protein kinase [Acidobacteriota bacterium]
MMEKERFHQIEELFHAVRGLPPEDRDIYLDTACGEDTDLRAEVDSLLVFNDDGSGELELHSTGAPEESGHSRPDQRTLAPLPAEIADPEAPGTLIGPYEILELIGEGGFGTVYLAQQTEPVRRKVALKIIKLGMDTRQVIARFEAERQALALTDHPNIAKVLDGGATQSGRPYFVMELVRGLPITEYCDLNRFSAIQRLKLFIPVCRAVQHAHQKGIIHRDIKPSNVLVTLQDGQPVPKIIDFGIAKATKGSLTEKTLFTELRQFIGTPAYMSPEQAEMSGLDIDTRSDIYSLGVLLYELLTGTTPLDSTRLSKAGYGEILRLIRDEDPVTPSVRVGQLGEDARKTALRRSSEPSALSKLFRGDLDWIVLRAMEKDRTRRYQSASELAEDIQRHLDNRPVLAGPPSTFYRIAKFVRRHRAMVSTAALVLLALIVGLALATAGFLQASRQRNAAEEARLEARAEAERSQAISDFLQRIMTQIDSHTSGEASVETGDLIDEAKRLFGENHPTVAAALSSLGLRMQNTGRLEDAETLFRESLQIWSNLDDDGYNLGVVQGRLGKLLYLSGRDDESEEHLRASIDLFSQLPEGAGLAFCDPRLALGELLNRRGQSQAAIEQFQEVLRLRQKLTPDQRYEIAVVREMMVQALLADQRTQEAAEITLLLARDYQATFPGGLIDANAHLRAGRLLLNVGRSQEAERLLRRAIRLYGQMDQPPNDLMLFAYDGLFQILRRNPQRIEEALGMSDTLMDLMRRTLGQESIELAPHFAGLAQMAEEAGQLDRALQTALEAHRLVRSKAEAAQNSNWDSNLERMQSRVHRINWRIATLDGREPASYERAYQAQKLLSEDAPADMDFQRTLGVLAYRAGEDQAALEQLSRVQELRRRSELGDSPVVEAFSALACFRLGLEEQAREHLSALRHLLSLPIHADDEEKQELLAYTEEQLGRISRMAK